MKKDLVTSFTGHLLVFLTIGLFASRQKPKELTHPSVITVQILKSGVTEPEKPTPTPQLVAPTPKPIKSVEKKKIPEKPKSNLRTRKDDAVVRKAGLGAKVEGARALGYNYYLQQMLERISENWHDPYQRSERKLQATVVFVIERDGKLTEIKVERGSGDALYDEVCLRAVLITRKLPPLPNEFTAPRLKIHLEFER